MNMVCVNFDDRYKESLDYLKEYIKHSQKTHTCTQFDTDENFLHYAVSVVAPTGATIVSRIVV
jgi:hypothetical protein